MYNLSSDANNRIEKENHMLEAENHKLNKELKEHKNRVRLYADEEEEEEFQKI